MFARQIKKSILNRNILIWVLIIAVTAAFGVGIVEPGSVAIAEEAVTVNGNEQSQQSLSNEPVQSINFKKDWSVRDALQFLAAEYHKNIVNYIISLIESSLQNFIIFLENHRTTTEQPVLKDIDIIDSIYNLEEIKKIAEHFKDDTKLINEDIDLINSFLQLCKERENIK